MYSRDIYFSSKKAHRTHENMYRYDSPFGKYANISSQSESSIGKDGKSAYDIAVENGFQGTVQEWLESLHGISPHIGENGNWFIGDKDTGISAKGDSESIDINRITEQDIDSYFDGEVIVDGKTDHPITKEEIDSYFSDEGSESHMETLTFEEIDKLFNQ